MADIVVLIFIVGLMLAFFWLGQISIRIKLGSIMGRVLDGVRIEAVSTAYLNGVMDTIDKIMEEL